MLWHIHMILILHLLTVSFFFSKPIIFFECSLQEAQNFFMESFPRYKLCLFSIWSNPQIVDIEYSQGICLPIFVFKEFAHPTIFLIKDSISARIMSGILSEFIYWLNFNISSFSDGLQFHKFHFYMLFHET